MEFPPDPSLKDLNVFWEKQYWHRSKINWHWAAKFYEEFMHYFSEDRKPRDVFRSDVRDWRHYLQKIGRSNSRICRYFEYGSRFYRLLNELELVEKDFNPFLGMTPRRIKD